MAFMDVIKTPRIDNVILKKAYDVSVQGTLCLTRHHVIFSAQNPDEDEILLLYNMVELVLRKVSGLSGTVTLVCKNFTTIKFRIPGLDESLNVCNSIENLSIPDAEEAPYPFFSGQAFRGDDRGWMQYNFENEKSAILDAADCQWRPCNINKDFNICRSYPSSVYVPTKATDDLIVKAAKFRHGGRFPVLAYCHKKNGVSLVRCSQPLIQGRSKRCKEDEKIVNFILDGHGGKGHIIDTRSQAIATSQKGGGVEIETNYPQWKRHFQSIDRISSLTESLSKLIDACSDVKSSSFQSKLENCGWLSYVESVLRSALSIVLYMESGTPILLHGDSGKDITLMLSSLVQLMLNPHCRTIKGFQGLITREWLWAGHPFADRNIKVGIAPSQSKTQAPVFLCFLDCVHQIRSQYPCSFEFRDEYLLCLAENSYASDYGTFLYNNQSERQHRHVEEKTVALWVFFSQPNTLMSYLNPLYQRNDRTLHPSIAPQSVSLWTEMFMKRTQPKGVDSSSSMWSHARESKDENETLKATVLQLQRQHNELQEEVRKLCNPA